MGLENKELYIGEDAKNKLVEGIDKLAEAVLSTMGPMGRTVIRSDEYGRPYVTKDGVSVANAIKFRDPVENIGATLIKEVAQKTADEGGDGTTTSICLAQSFIKLGLELIGSEVPVTKVQREIDLLVQDALTELKTFSKELLRTDIYKVATISANNDPEIGSLIQKAYNHSDIVKVEEGKNKHDEIEIINGMIHPVSYYSPHFINNDKKKEVNYDNAAVLVLDKKLEDLTPFKPIFEHCERTQTPLVIFTEFVSDNVLRLLETNAINKYIKVVAVKVPGFGTYRKDNISDIALFTGARVITNIVPGSLVPHAVLGTVKNISVSKVSTVLCKADNIDVKARILDLQEQAKLSEQSDYDRSFIFDRIDNLKGTLSVIKVGGTSEVEMKERKDRIDDAVLAVKSALEEGIVEGGGTALARVYDVLSNHKNTNVRKVLLGVLLSPSFTIFLNSNGEINHKPEINRFELNVIDPFKVTRCALENAASVAKTILSTNAVILNENLWN